MRRSGFAYPYAVYAFTFFLAPLLLVFFYSVTVAAPGGGLSLTLSNYVRFFDFREPQYMKVLFSSFRIAFVATAICLALGYPTAYILSRLQPRWRNFLSLLFILPMWMNFLLRTYSWMSLLENNGIINTALKAMGFAPLSVMYTEKAIVLGMVYNFLPFMILPIYNMLVKLDTSLLDASSDLGASPARTFVKVTLPLTMPGILSGINMVFMPSVTTFVISRLLGGTSTVLIGDLIEKQFKLVDDKGFGSAMSVIIMIFVFGIMLLTNRNKDDEEGGVML
ncbi:MAG TPA: ABC transporter permease [Candidatus Acidoferrum sp.]|nr:ABC transporter permease [Candidatus Acidoferrum sp.]